MKAKSLFFYTLLSLFLCSCEKKPTSQENLHVKSPPPSPLPQSKEALKSELALISTDAYVEAYIIKVINEGSKGTLGFSGGAMDAGIATKEDAPNIARYVMSLSKRKSSDDTLGAHSELFYTSNCGGCHGNDGKGLGGAFPDLTLKTYIGLEKRQRYLESSLREIP